MAKARHKDVHAPFAAKFRYLKRVNKAFLRQQTKHSFDLYFDVRLRLILIH